MLSVPSVDNPFSITPVASLANAGRYHAPVRPAGMKLVLDLNEGPAVAPEILASLAKTDGETLRRYPDASRLEKLLAEKFGVAASRVVVTAGGDDAIERMCRATLAPGREMILPAPTFEMFRRYAHFAGAKTVDLAWPSGAFPTDAVIAAINDNTRLIAVVSPNNPTGAVATANDLRRVAEAAPHALVLLDGAYAEFADEDLTAAALALPNVAIVRTFSKARGLAGLRVGYAVAPERVADWMRAVGAPFANAALSLAVAENDLVTGDARLASTVAQVKTERVRLQKLLTELGAEALPTQANFVLAKVSDPTALRDALFARGIAIRSFAGKPGMENFVRISCPVDPAGMDCLESALREAFKI